VLARALRALLLHSQREALSATALQAATALADALAGMEVAAIEAHEAGALAQALAARGSPLGAHALAHKLKRKG
jgi:hypothetical protein